MIKSSGKLGSGVKDSEEASRNREICPQMMLSMGAEVKWGKMMEGNRDSRGGWGWRQKTGRTDTGEGELRG